jgi:hypothetical protein
LKRTASKWRSSAKEGMTPTPNGVRLISHISSSICVSEFSQKPDFESWRRRRKSVSSGAKNNPYCPKFSSLRII